MAIYDNHRRYTIFLEANIPAYGGLQQMVVTRAIIVLRHTRHGSVMLDNFLRSDMEGWWYHRIISRVNKDTSPIKHTPMQPGLAALTASQTDSLSVLLQLGDQGIPVLHHIRVLLVLIVGPVGLDNPVDPIDRAGDPVARDEFRQVPKNRAS